jgi:hypothetical protein
MFFCLGFLELKSSCLCLLNTAGLSHCILLNDCSYADTCESLCALSSHTNNFPVAICESMSHRLANANLFSLFQSPQGEISPTSSSRSYCPSCAQALLPCGPFLCSSAGQTLSRSKALAHAAPFCWNIITMAYFTVGFFIYFWSQLK